MKVLCICTRNTKISPMVAALLSQKFTEEGVDIEVDSAGISQINAGYPAHPLAVECMEAYDLDIRSHKSKWVGEVDLQSFDLILCRNEAEEEYLKSKYGDDLPRIKRMELPHSPVGHRIEKYHDYADRIQDILEMLQPLIEYIYNHKHIGATS